MTTKTDHTPPKATKGDTAHALVRAGVSAIPLVGSPAVELLNLIVAPPIEKRRQAWFEEIGEALRNLEASGTLKLEDLRDNEAFVDTVLHATQAALRTSQQEKREALRNAVLNSAKPSSPDEHLQQSFIYLVDSMTDWHLKLLKFLDNPPKWFQANGRQVPQYFSSSSLSGIICEAFPELKTQRSLYDQVGKDLYLRGLINTDGFHAMMSATGAYAERSTDLGKRFLAYISAPAT